MGRFVHMSSDDPISKVTMEAMFFFSLAHRAQEVQIAPSTSSYMYTLTTNHIL